MKKSYISFIITAMCLTGCKVSLSTDVNFESLKKLTPEMTDYAKEVLQEFYDYELESVLGRVDPNVSDNFSLELLEQISDFSHETAQPQNAVKFGHTYKTEDDLKYVAIKYNVPNLNGREEVTLSLSYGKDSCCKLVGLYAQIRIGDQYKMPEFKPPSSTDLSPKETSAAE